MNETPDSLKTLSNCTLPKEMMSALLPILHRRGLTFTEVHLHDPIAFVREDRLANGIAIKDGPPLQPEHRCLFIPAWMWEKRVPGVVDSINSLAFAFPKGSSVHVFTDSSFFPGMGIHNIIERRWPQITEGSVNWIGQRDINDFMQVFQIWKQEDFLLHDMLGIWNR